VELSLAPEIPALSQVPSANYQVQSRVAVFLRFLSLEGEGPLHQLNEISFEILEIAFRRYGVIAIFILIRYCLMFKIRGVDLSVCN
jgi:hypothetical protein